ncbi:hypothetical protein [Pectobacterium aroidearum]|uniref:hypothetical protein n=1 Tax=Pectobacterium aroidearum TaxID=1201031 RepID=UPI0032EDD5B8
MSNDDEGVDLSGPAPIVRTEPIKQELDPDILLRRDKHDAMERRGMRLVLFTVVLVFGVIFLAKGLCFALDVGQGLLNAKASIVKALAKQDESKCLIPLKCLGESNHVVNTSSSGDLLSVANLNTDWLSASSLIAIVAFILGVGLTLMLTLLKAAFQHPTDKSANRDKDQSAMEIATPLSQLIVNFVNFLKEKFSK